MNGDTKSKIKTLRALLVGVLPVPTDQIKQITLALIYKFMSDQNKTLKDLGGGDFFAGEYAPFAWTRLMDPAVSAAERVKLYRDGLEKMAANPNIPDLFREIFRGAYLPFNNPATLDMFLKGINEIAYTHSEDLGDAYEGLLSTMDAQGDAGQFRTPRHIIEFIVAAVDPKKGMRVLDPACGTAGFLVSAYRHILKANTRPGSPELGSALAPDERASLADDFCGYDISSDMARLSRVNLYLHLFPDPKIFEYDTLTSLERWDEMYDCILTNPPFMSPSGGIQPHNRFSIPSKRSEVLFVDYILDHLTPDGRAGIIVPEGIIFQSQNAHKALRKKLVKENYIYAVVSLPAGVFQPYSGVKTSILLIDRVIARKCKEILFVKIENDGFSLGAQRNPIEKNDLNNILGQIRELKNSLIKTETNHINLVLPFQVFANKEVILSDGEFSLVSERYSVKRQNNKIQWPLVSIGDLCELGRGRVISKNFIDANKGPFPVYSSQTQNDGIFGFLNTFDFDGDYVTWTTDGANAGTVFYRTGKFNCTNVCGTLKPINDLVNLHYLALTLNHVAKEYVIQVGNPKLMNKEVAKIKIPLPPLDIQRKIVDEIEGYQKIIDGARMVVENWKPKIKLDPEWPRKKIGDMCKLMTGGTPTSSEKKYYENGTIRWLVSGDIHKREIVDCEKRITQLGMDNSNTKYLPEPSVLIALNGQGKTRGTVAVLKTKATCNQSLVSISPNNNQLLNIDFLYYVLRGMYTEIRNLTGDNQRSGLSMSIIKNIEIPVPRIEIQRQVAGKLEEEQNAVDNCDSLINGQEEAINMIISDIWGEEVENEKY